MQSEPASAASSRRRVKARSPTMLSNESVIHIRQKVHEKVSALISRLRARERGGRAGSGISGLFRVFHDFDAVDAGHSLDRNETEDASGWAVPRAPPLIPPVGPGTTRPTIIRFATMFPGRKARTSSSSVEAGRSTRRFRISLGTPKATLISMAATPGTISPISCWATPTPIPSSRYKTRAFGTTFHGPLTPRTPGVSTLVSL
jgi:hypothetical protein